MESFWNHTGYGGVCFLKVTCISSIPLWLWLAFSLANFLHRLPSPLLAIDLLLNSLSCCSLHPPSWCCPFNLIQNHHPFCLPSSSRASLSSFPPRLHAEAVSSHCHCPDFAFMPPLGYSGDLATKLFPSLKTMDWVSCFKGQGLGKMPTEQSNEGCSSPASCYVLCPAGGVMGRTPAASCPGA